MALITVDAVVDISVHIGVVEIVRVIATMASGALEDRVIIGVDVARGAHTIGTAVSDREPRVLRVVERGVGPRRRGMARRARGREELRLCRVARVGRVVVIGLMAADASGRQCRVVAVDVAERTSRGRVGTGQRECRVVVVERRVRPERRVMAQFAGLREARRHVVGTRRALIVCQVAGYASGAGQVVVAVNVAVGASARRHGVRAGQREARAVVVKGRTQPS